MTKQTANMAAAAALILAVIALILQIVSAGHPTRVLLSEVAWPILLIVAIGLFVWGRTLKS